jgi:hypothetical protein
LAGPTFRADPAVRLRRPPIVVWRLPFVGQDERGVNGVFVQDFVPGRDTTTTRRKLGGFDLENSTETLAISPDGKFLTVGGWEQMFNVMIADGVPGIEPTRHGPS